MEPSRVRDIKSTLFGSGRKNERERERCTWAQRLRIFLKLNAEFCYREYVEQELHVDAMDLVHVVEIQHDFQLYLPINYWQL